MKLIRGDAAFVVAGRAYTGFPIVLDDADRIVEPAHWFLLHECIERGRVASKHTWARLGQTLYDYFGYLGANGLAWDSMPPPGKIGPLASYRDWAKGTCGLKASTINVRLRTLSRFYRWAVKQGLIQALPFEFEHVIVPARRGFLAHVSSGEGRTISPDVMLRENKEPIKVLTKEQIRVLLSSVDNPTHRLMLRLGLQTGLRSDELRSFPEAYVINPDSRRDVSNKVNVRCSPSDMRLKGDKGRVIHVPRLLMADLWDYSIRVRPRLQKRGAQSSPALLLTKTGAAFSASAIASMFTSIGERIGFHVTPHMLRHSFATHTLFAMRERGSKVDPLLYVRDQLGHASVTSTEVYLRLLDEIQDDLLTSYQEEIDALFDPEGDHGGA